MQRAEQRAILIASSTNNNKAAVSLLDSNSSSVLSEMDTVTAEKIAARRRYGRVRHLHTAFRCVEALAAVCLLSWSSARLSSLARLSADLLRRLVAALLTPRFIFLLGNAIVLTLFAMSCRRPAPSGGSGDIYDQFFACQRRVVQSPPPPPQPAAAEKAEEPPVLRREKAGRAYRRSRSERAKRRRVEPDLRRSASELSREEAAAEAERAALEERKEEDAEEFRQMVESFIATQLKRFHREESMDVGVVPASSAGEPHASTTALHL